MVMYWTFFSFQTSQNFPLIVLDSLRYPSEIFYSSSRLAKGFETSDVCCWTRSGDLGFVLAFLQLVHLAALCLCFSPVRCCESETPACHVWATENELFSVLEYVRAVDDLDNAKFWSGRDYVLWPLTPWRCLGDAMVVSAIFPAVGFLDQLFLDQYGRHLGSICLSLRHPERQSIVVDAEPWCCSRGC